MKLKRPFEKIVGIVTGLAFVMILSQTTGDSMAYFTTYATAEGGQAITYQVSRTEIDEEVDGWNKSITVKNTGSVPCYVRALAFAGEGIGLNYSSESGKWTLGNDGYYYYSDILPLGGSTETLVVDIVKPEGVDYDVDVIVIQESVPVSYLADGTPYANWSLRREAAQ